MSKIIKTTFGIVPNSLLNDNTISLKAKGLYAYMHSKPDNWDFTINGIASQLLEQYKAVASALKELENAGYLTRKNYQGEAGKWTCDYYLHIEPTLPHPTSLQPTPLQGRSADGMTKKERIREKDKEKKKELATLPKNPILEKVIEVLPELRGTPHIPHIINALEKRQDKWLEYLMFIVQYKRDKVHELAGWDLWFWKDYISHSYKPISEQNIMTEEDLAWYKERDINPYGIGYWNDQFKNNTLSTG